MTSITNEEIAELVSDLRQILQWGYTSGRTVETLVERAADALESLSREREWLPIETADKGPYLLFWPAKELNEDGSLGKELPRDRGLIGVGDRISPEHMWEEPDSLNAVGRSFDDDFEYDNPTHWCPLPPPPKIKGAKG